MFPTGFEVLLKRQVELVHLQPIPSKIICVLKQRLEVVAFGVGRVSDTIPNLPQALKAQVLAGPGVFEYTLFRNAAAIALFHKHDVSPDKGYARALRPLHVMLHLAVRIVVHPLGVFARLAFVVRVVVNVVLVVVVLRCGLVKQLVFGQVEVDNVVVVKYVVECSVAHVQCSVLCVYSVP